MQLANEQLGWISARTPSILVAGTNGKGTTSSFLWRLLALGGLRCGLFTSPHLLSFAERIQMSDRPVTENELEAAIPGLVAQIDPGLWAELSFFEASLLLGFLTWRRRNSDLNVLEVGLGGRLDATNIVSPVASIITSIGIDHTTYLGRRISRIAFEKAGSIHPGRPVVVGFAGMDHDNMDALKVIASAAESRSADLYLAGRDFGVEGGKFYFFFMSAPSAVLILIEHQCRIGQAVAPVAHAVENILQRRPQGGQFVDHPRRCLRKGLARHQSVFLEASKPVRQRVGADPG